MNPRNIVLLRCFLHYLICLLLAIVSAILLYFAIKAPKPCDVSALTLIESVFPTFVTIVICTITFEIVCLGWAMDTPNDPSMHTSWTGYFSITGKVLLGKIVFVFPAQWFNRICDANRKDRKKNKRAAIESETNGFDHAIDPREPPTCSPGSYRHWTSLEMILALIVLEFVVFLLVYTIVRIKSMFDQPIQARRESKPIEAPAKHESIWFHRINRNRNTHRYFDHRELVAFLTKYAADAARSPSQPFCVKTVAVIDLNSKSDEIDRLIYSMIIFQCKVCHSDNGIYLVITSDFHRRSRLVKISSIVPSYVDRRAQVWAYVQHGLAMCVFKYGGIVEDTTRFVLHHIRDNWKRDFDVTHAFEEFESGGCFWCLKDDGRELGRRPIWRKQSTYIRIIYYCIPIDQINIGFAFKQSLWEIRRNGTVKTNRLQEITYGSNWRFTDHFRLIRTSRGEVGVIGELVDSNITAGGHDQEVDGARWTTCVVYSPETRKLSATGDYEKYLQIDPALRQYFDRNFHEYESMRSMNFRSMRRSNGKFLCPQVLTDVRAIDVMDDGSIRSIDFEPRSLKWLSLRKVYEAYGKRKFDKYLALGLKRMMGVDLDKRF